MGLWFSGASRWAKDLIYGLRFKVWGLRREARLWDSDFGRSGAELQASCFLENPWDLFQSRSEFKVAGLEWRVWVLIKVVCLKIKAVVALKVIIYMTKKQISGRFTRGTEAIGHIQSFLEISDRMLKMIVHQNHTTWILGLHCKRCSSLWSFWIWGLGSVLASRKLNEADAVHDLYLPPKKPLNPEPSSSAYFTP